MKAAVRFSPHWNWDWKNSVFVLVFTRHNQSISHYLVTTQYVISGVIHYLNSKERILHIFVQCTLHNNYFLMILMMLCCRQVNQQAKKPRSGAKSSFLYKCLVLPIFHNVDLGWISTQIVSLEKASFLTNVKTINIFIAKVQSFSTNLFKVLVRVENNLNIFLPKLK